MMNNVYIKRRENKLKQSDVADKVGMSTKSYQLKETGKREFTIQKGLMLTKVFDCTLDDLFGNCESIQDIKKDKDDEFISEITNHLENNS